MENLLFFHLQRNAQPALKDNIALEEKLLQMDYVPLDMFVQLVPLQPHQQEFTHFQLQTLQEHAHQDISVNKVHIIPNHASTEHIKI